MDLHATPYRLFLKVAELGSFTQAAKAENISQPALSSRIRELERLIGFKLFSRTSRKVELTPEGRTFIGSAQRIVIETDWVNQKARLIRTNHLRVGLFYYSALVKKRTTLTDGFSRDFKHVPMQCTTMSQAKLFQALKDDELDIVIALLPKLTMNTNGVVRDEVMMSANDHKTHPKLDALEIGMQNVSLWVPQSHEFYEYEKIRAEQLAGENVAILNRFHSVSLAETIARRLTELKVNIVTPPEGDALSMRRFSDLTGCLSIDLGWFQPEQKKGTSRAVSRYVEGLGLTTVIEVFRQFGSTRPFTQDFWDFASRTSEN